jgi:hypothetical protein
MPVERREQAIAMVIGSTGNGRNPIFNGRRQPSCDGTSRMMREYQVRICERLGVKFPGPTRLVSRASPVHTAVRNCTRDEGRPFGFGDQVADPKPPRVAAVKSRGGERRGNVGTMIPAGKVERGERKQTASEASKAD